jgi:hypothetical protein
MIPCHLIPNDFVALTADVKNILTSLSNKRMSILTPTDKLNLEVASCNHPSHNVMKSVSSLLLENYVGEDGLPSQSTYKDNIQDFDESGMVVTSLLEHCPPPTPMLTHIYGAIMKMLKEIRAQITLKKTLHVIDSRNMSINANIAEVQAKDIVFSNIDNIDFVDQTFTNQLARFWHCADIHHSSILKNAIVKGFVIWH